MFILIPFIYLSSHLHLCSCPSPLFICFLFKYMFIPIPFIYLSSHLHLLSSPSPLFIYHPIYIYAHPHAFYLFVIPFTFYSSSPPLFIALFISIVLSVDALWLLNHPSWWRLHAFLGVRIYGYGGVLYLACVTGIWVVFKEITKGKWSHYQSLGFLRCD